MGIVDAIKDALGVYDDAKDFFDRLAKMKAYRERVLTTIQKDGELLASKIDSAKTKDDLRFVTDFVKSSTGSAGDLEKTLTSDLAELRKLKAKATKLGLSEVLRPIEEADAATSRLLVENRKLIQALDTVDKKYRAIKAHDGWVKTALISTGISLVGAAVGIYLKLNKEPLRNAVPDPSNARHFLPSNPRESGWSEEELQQFFRKR